MGLAVVNQEFFRNKEIGRRLGGEVQAFASLGCDPQAAVVRTLCRCRPKSRLRISLSCL